MGVGSPDGAAPPLKFLFRTVRGCISELSVCCMWQCFVMPSGSPSGVCGGVTSSHHHHPHHRHLATTITTSSSSSNISMSSTSLSGQHQQVLSRTNLYIRGLKPETSDKDLVTLCQQLVLCTYDMTRYKNTIGWKKLHLVYSRRMLCLFVLSVGSDRVDRDDRRQKS